MLFLAAGHKVQIGFLRNARLNTVGASVVTRDTDTVSQRRSFIDGTCLSQKGWHESAAHRAHPGRREMGTRPTPFPFSTRAKTALAGKEHVPPPIPPPRAEVSGGQSTRPPLAVVTGEQRRRSDGPAGREREERLGDRRKAP